MSDKILPIIILSGWSCAGKSTIAEILAGDISFDLIKIYEVYHSLSIKKGFSRSREWLAKVGDEEFVKETMYEIVSKIKLLEYSKGIVIDASFSFLMNCIINVNFPNARVINIAILSNYKNRLKRMVKRMNVSSIIKAINEMKFRDEFLEDIYLINFLAKSDFEVSNNIDDNIEKVIEKIKKKLLKFKTINCC